MPTPPEFFKNRPESRLDSETRDTLKWWLLVAGLLLVGAGAPPVLSPIVISFASGGADVGLDLVGLEQQRAVGRALLTLGLLTMSGAIFRSLSLTAAIGGSAMYLAYGVARLSSAPAGAMPSTVLVAATVLELMVGALIVAAFLFRGRRVVDA